MAPGITVARTALLAPLVDFGPDICTSLEAATQREWLVTNGLGGFASGTISGVLTRRYHGLLVAALQPPAGRTLLVPKVDEILTYDGVRYELGANRWGDGSVSPTGFLHLTRFHLHGSVPVWTFTCADAVIEKRVWMRKGSNTTFMRYDLARGTTGTADLEVKVLANCRGFHNTTRANDFWPGESAPVEHGLRVTLRPPGAPAMPIFILSETASAEPRREWYRNFELTAEAARGLGDRDDHYFAGIFRMRLTPGKPLLLLFSTEAHALIENQQALERRVAEDEKLLEYWVAAHPNAALDAPPWVRQLVLAAEQFTVSRAAARQPGRGVPESSEVAPAESAAIVQTGAATAAGSAAAVPRTAEAAANAIIAGYPWFGEWGRDTMIALPGLTLQTGRADVARAILRAAANWLDQGMLPNFFPELRPEVPFPEVRSPETASSSEVSTSEIPLRGPQPPGARVPGLAGGAPAPSGLGQKPQYNSVDATLWFFEALRQYDDATSDHGLIGELFEVLGDILDWHVRGTRFGIVMDPADGLLRAGEPGVQLTWMDAKVNERVVTPRMGKPVEINALWYNALRTMSRFAFELSKPTKKYIQMAEQTFAGFARFWNAEVGHCFDVLDGPGGNDATLRPNQIFAVSLPESPLDAAQRRAVVDICARRLLTPVGLRSLTPLDLRYHGVYQGTQTERDAAYHQGTVWTWLLGPFILAHMRVYNDFALASRFLEPIAHSLLGYGLGTVNEIFDGDPPFRPRGAIAQAWSVGEVLRAWHLCYQAGFPARRAARG